MKKVDLQKNFEERKQKWPWLISTAKRYFDIWVTDKATKHLRSKRKFPFSFSSW